MRTLVRAMRMALFLSAAVCLQPAFGQDESAKKAAASIVEQILKEHGIDSAVAKLRQLLTDSADAYVFSEWQISFAARWLGWQERREEGLALFERSTELFEESPVAWSNLGAEHLLLCDSMEAAACLKRALDLNPDISYTKWLSENLGELLKIARVQVATQEKYAPGENTGIQGPYLGQEPPGPTPRVFAPGIVSNTADEFSLSLSPDGREIYFSRAGRGVMICRWEEQGWTAPALVDLFEDGRDADEPNVAPDGNWIFFNARLTLFDERTIYRAGRTGDGWGEPERLFSGMFATAALSGTLYYTEVTGRPDYGVIAKRRPTEEGYSEPELLGGGVNTEHIEGHPCIAADESFIIFDSNRGEDNGLYVCYRQADGSWGDAIRLNQHLDIPPFAGQPALSPDRKYLFFALHDDIYWVSADILDDLQKDSGE